MACVGTVDFLKLIALSNSPLDQSFIFFDQV